MYILDDEGNPIPCLDVETWGRWMEDHRRVAWDEVGPFRVSTVFLGIDHSFRDRGPPVLWETMIFAPEDHSLSDYQERYTSRAAAIEGHARALARVPISAQPGPSPGGR